MTSQPRFDIACNHGVVGGPTDVVARFEWRDDDGGYWWLPLQFTATVMTPLDGDAHAAAHLGMAPSRVHYEIPCQASRCNCRAYRVDAVKLQTLFHLIAEHAEFRTVIASKLTDGVATTDSAITVTLDALHYARDTAKQYGLPV
jgi:hypothetical protein